MNRRTYLTVATASVASLTGCVGVSGFFGGDSLSSKPFDSNPAANDIDRNPVLGASKNHAPSTVVAFEDPSCPVCQKFTIHTFPKLRTNLLDSGKTEFVYRSFPHVEKWANAAVNVLYAVNDQSGDAFWKLNDHVYQNQDAVSKDNVYSFTRTFLREKTSVDTDMAIAKAKKQAYGDMIKADMTAVDEANVSGTPTFFLFKNGEFKTTIVGNENYSVFKNSLA